MTQKTSSPVIIQAVVKRTSAPCREHFEVVLAAAQFPHAAPGQFIQILCHDVDALSIPETDPEFALFGANAPHSSDALTESPMLRRPFSIGGLKQTPVDVELSIMGRIVGSGTRWLSELQIGQRVDILGPLGRAFTPPPSGHRALLVAGGVGLPPIRWFGKTLSTTGIGARMIFGAQSRSLIPLSLSNAPADASKFDFLADEFSSAGIPQIMTTDDGSFGLKGRVTAALEPALKQDADLTSLHVFACGPEPMLEAVARTCEANGVRCELALERVMGCGVGTCQSCVVPVRDESAEEGWRYALCCREGPVFESHRLIWPSRSTSDAPSH